MIKELWFQASHFYSQMWAGLWPIKAPLSLAAGFYSGYMGGDWVMLLIFSAMIAIDLFFGTLLAFRLQRFDLRIFGRWVVKVGTHFFVIAIVGLAMRSILAPLGMSFPLLDLFLGLLICTEALSILKNMQKLDLPVPKLAARLLADVQEKAEQKAADFFSMPENDRRRTPRDDQDRDGMGPDDED